MPLSGSQPTVISVPARDFADAEGNAQGSVSFRTADGETGVLARMSVADGTELKQVSELK